MDDEIIESVLAFWFEEGTVPGLCEFRPVWFASTPSFDAATKGRFTGPFERAAAGELDHLSGTPRGALALVIALDQFPRNLFRAGPRAFATDAKARSVARSAVERGYDSALPPLQRIFLYMPLQHSEDLQDQILSVDLFEALDEDKAFDFIKEAARRHLGIVERFGRFPHRNAALGRPATAEEQQFLASAEGKSWTA